ncbi:MAG: DNA mismatch repair endonuclease MutL [Clostridium sp.]|jgi:DNA mismatch repair protein MutL|nr:DNA mismatch repair endonuclease MutL [Clostridium sp.]
MSVTYFSDGETEAAMPDTGAGTRKEGSDTGTQGEEDFAVENFAAEGFGAADAPGALRKIQVLDEETIDKIAAGEVVERPSSVVKELVENSIDAGATAVTVEIKEGGIEWIRVTDNGCGMEASQVRTAFLRHATSKIRTAQDLHSVTSLGFRGEALSSIAAVSKVEAITKTAAALTGIRLVLDGAAEKSLEEIGVPSGTTFIMRNLFFNTPARRKFLRQPASEGGYVAELMEHLALSRPDISFQFIMGGHDRFHTSGNGDLKEVIYRIYGKEISSRIFPVFEERSGIRIEGYLGTPELLRANRNFEVYFLNGRFIKSRMVAGAIEEGYRSYLMQRRFPFCILHITVLSGAVDVNVHPSKMDVRFADPAGFCALLSETVRNHLRGHEMIPELFLGGKRETAQASERQRKREEPSAPEPFETARAARLAHESHVPYEGRPPHESHVPHESHAPHESYALMEEAPYGAGERGQYDTGAHSGKSRCGESVPSFVQEILQDPSDTKDRDLFEEKILTAENRSRYRILGQVFDTYWLMELEEKLLIIDQHAAHEKVKYERLMKQYRERAVLSQGLLPPLIVSLTGQEETVLREQLEVFGSLGFEIEHFGGSEYALRSVPVELYGCGEKELFLEVLDELTGTTGGNHPKAAEEKIASMSCKAAVKGNARLSLAEAQSLLDELLLLENPYHCPHGRPTVISMSRTELEKKFKRIV